MSYSKSYIVNVHEHCHKSFAEGRQHCCCHFPHDCIWVFCKNCKESMLNCRCKNYEAELMDNDGNIIQEDTKIRDIVQRVWNNGYGQGRGDSESTLKNKDDYLTVEEAIKAIVEIISTKDTKLAEAKAVVKRLVEALKPLSGTGEFINEHLYEICDGAKQALDSVPKEVME